MAIGWRHLLLPLTPLYAGVARARAAAYSRGWMPSQKLAVPVVSVGNLSFGGTGKTPTTVSLVRDLVRRGRRPTVLSRGYGRRSRDPVVVIGPEPVVTAEHAGDEPLEMARRLPGVPIVVDGDRVRGGILAISGGADILVLDDGFQHLRLVRDLDLVLIDAGDPWAGGSLPPRGRLREPLSALRRASAVLVTKLAGETDGRFDEIRSAVRERVPGLTVLGSSLRPRRVRCDGEWQPVELLVGARVFAFAGVGRPQAFAELLETAGAEVVAERWFADHHRYTEGELAAIREQARSYNAVPVTTAKDAVKLPPECEAWVVEAEVQPLGGTWDELWQLLQEAWR